MNLNSCILIHENIVKLQVSLQGKKMSVGHWTFLSNHVHVLVCIAREPSIRVRDIAHRAGLTERGTLRIIAELEEAGYLSHRREGRRNVYRIDLSKQLRHELEAGVSVRELLSCVVASELLDEVDAARDEDDTAHD